MIIDFVRNYWKEILDVLILVISLVFFILRKKPVKVSDTLKQLISSWLPGVINAAEKTDLKGSLKLDYAVNMVYDIFCSDYITREEFDQRYLPFVKSQIEAILSTPKKKGD